ncbi:hypothetical protein, partial [Rhodoplanes sp. SY1]|uniref:hypothetical protein n=1 Tax=Rhodoplanes sp. SY1 TaxID=3166646 RepID=UPI0038B5016B
MDSYREALDLAETIGDATRQATCAFNLGHAYKNIAEIRDLDVAERWYRYDFELTPATDKLGRGKDLAQLGAVAYERFAEARTAERPIEELKRYLGEAARLYEEALAMMPPSAIVDHGIFHNQLGNIYEDAGATDR